MQLPLSLLVSASWLLAVGQATELGTPSTSLSVESRDDHKQVNEKCSKLLENSIEAGHMLPSSENYMSGFPDIMSGQLLALSKYGPLKIKEEKLAADINMALQVIKYSGSSDSSQSLTDITGTPAAGKAKKGEAGKKARTAKTLPRPEPGTIYLSAVNSKVILPKLIEDLDPDSIGLRTLAESGGVRYFSLPKHQVDSTAPRILFFIPEMEQYDPLALGEALLKQRFDLHQRSIEIVQKIKAYLIELREGTAQFIFTGYGSGAILAQLAAIRLNFDIDLTLYKHRHRVISIVFGDVRVLSPSFIGSIGAYGFDHRDHLSFCSTEAFLPINVAQKGRINWVGKRIEFSLKELSEKYKTPEPTVVQSDLSKAVILPATHSLLKYLHWDIFKLHAMPAFEAYEEQRGEDKSLQIPKAIEALQDHFKTYRLKAFPHIFVDCVHDQHGDEFDAAIPNSRLICTVKDTNSKAELQFFFRVYWADDVHDISESFIETLMSARKEQNRYTKVKKEKEESASLSKGKKATVVSPRYRFSNWVQFFQSQLSESVTPNESVSRCINPFFDESIYFELEGGQFKYSLCLCSEVLLERLHSKEARDQKLIKILFGPLNPTIPYKNVNMAKQLFSAPRSEKSDTQASLVNVISEMFRAHGTSPTMANLVAIDREKVLSSDAFRITKMGSNDMNSFQNALPLADIIELFNKPNKAKDCSYALPAKQCPKMCLLEIESPFWERMYHFNRVYIAFRGSGLGYGVETQVREFCERLSGREYEKIGSSLILKVVSNKLSFGNGYLPQYTFYMMIIQDPTN